MWKLKAVFLAMMAVLLIGCTYRGAYEGIQAGNRQACLKLPPSQYEECMQRAGKPYDEYERERQEVLKD